MQMRSGLFNVCGVWLLSLCVLACTAEFYTRPLYQVKEAPLAFAAERANLYQIGASIKRAGVAMGWHMQLVKPGLILGTLNARRHQAKISIAFTQTHYSIVYDSSEGLDYDGTMIQSKYNDWIRRLSNAIQSQVYLNQ